MFEPLDDDQWEQIEDHLYNGRKIDAIKLIRQWTGADLIYAKDMIDECDKQLRLQHPDRFAKPKAGGCATAVFVLAGGVAILTLNLLAA